MTTTGKNEYSAMLKTAQADYRERKLNIEKQMEEYRQTVSDIPPPKCISDKILLYIRYGIHKLWTMEQHQSDREEDYNNFFWWCMDKYKNHIRGEMKYTNMKPDSVASALLYMGCVINGIALTQRDICNVFGISTSVIRHHYRKIGRDLGMFRQ